MYYIFLSIRPCSNVSSARPYSPTTLLAAALKAFSYWVWSACPGRASSSSSGRIPSKHSAQMFYRRHLSRYSLPLMHPEDKQRSLDGGCRMSLWIASEPSGLQQLDDPRSSKYRYSEPASSSISQFINLVMFEFRERELNSYFRRMLFINSLILNKMSDSAN